MFHVSLISHLTDFNGRPSGEAYVQFTNVGDGKKALTKNKENMGHRWVGIGLLSKSLLFTSPGLGFSVLKGFRPVTARAQGNQGGESGSWNIFYRSVISLLVLIRSFAPQVHRGVQLQHERGQGRPAEHAGPGLWTNARRTRGARTNDARAWTQGRTHDEAGAIRQAEVRLKTGAGR